MCLTRSLLRILVLASILSAGCSPLLAPPSLAVPGGANAVAPAPNSSGPTLTTSDFPRGRFRAVSSPDMLVIAIENHGLYRVFLNNELLDSGQFIVAGPEIQVDSVKCENLGRKVASYAWSYDEQGGLAFQPDGPDLCPARGQYLAQKFEPQYLFIYQIPMSGFPG